MIKRIVITGGTSGIGRAAALGFAKAGWQVATCGRRQDRLDSLKSDADIALAAVCDVTDPEAVARFFAEVKRSLGGIDVVFNNAGVFAPMASIGDLDVDIWRRMVDVNLNGVFYVAREAFRMMREQSPQGGHLINTGSICAFLPRPQAESDTAT
jgi:NAD(P)-dependent dehydrogenase (short-subunit alcohol dehydrogenase family)